ncbi:MAG: electron transfer flavoprotein subunit alpha/FixB family protein [Micrococcales bacterium]|nr:electron transfer flavoprotein subunit alpha/FixB family protein [Micrococcales bacterium]
MSALVVVEPGHDAQTLVELARPVSTTVDVVVLGESGEQAAGADSTVVVTADGCGCGEATAALVAELVGAKGADLLVLASTERLREVAALLTARLDAACAPDAVALGRTDEGLTADRLLYGGVAIGTLALQRPVAIVTAAVKPSAGGGAPAPVQTMAAPCIEGKTLTGRTAVADEGGLANADRVVAFGRGVRTHDDIAMVRALADALGAELGCSRPIVDDLKWLDLPHQVGLTGTTVKPQLYVAVGISGQIQHLVGMRESKLIISINNNASAPIFEASDVAVVADLYEVVPRLAQALAARSA